MTDKISDFYCEVADSDPLCAGIVKLREQLTQAKAELAALRAECERLKEDATVKAGRLLYIADNINDNVAVRFGLEAREDEIIAVMKDAGWPIDARKAQP